MGKREGSLPPEYVKLLKVSELKKKYSLCVFFFVLCIFFFPFTTKLILVLEQSGRQRWSPTKSQWTRWSKIYFFILEGENNPIIIGFVGKLKCFFSSKNPRKRSVRCHIT